MAIVPFTLAAAQQEVGKNIREVAWNDSPRIREYLASVNVYTPAAWCAAFVYWCVREGSRNAKLNAVPLICSGSCPDIYSWASRKGILRDSPSVGDVFLLRDGNPQDPWSYYHNGLVAEVARGQVRTFEGNTNAFGSDEGDGVYANQRSLSSFITFVNWSSLAVTETYALYLGTEMLCEMPVINGNSLCPVRLLVQRLERPDRKISIQWDSARQLVVIDNRPLVAPVTLLNNAAHAPLRALLAHLGFTNPPVVDNRLRRVTL